MRLFRTFLVVIIIVGAVSWLGYTFWHAYQPRQVQVQGQIEAQQYTISSKIPGRIDQVFVHKGDQVQKGELIFTILSPEIDARLTQAQAGKDAAEALAEEANSGARSQQIAAARDKWNQAKAAAELMQKTFLRIDNLYKEGVVAEQKRDEAYTQLQATGYATNAAFQMFQMTKEGARSETRKAAESKARMAAGAVTEVEAFAAESNVESWHDGEVTQILLHSGELAPQGFPVVTIIDMKDAWAVFHVREDRLSEFSQGTQFTATIPALDNNRYTFRVSHVSVMGDFATWRATNGDKGFDMRSFEVEARPTETINGIRAGMSILIEK